MQYVLYEASQNIAIITLSRREALNALNTAMMEELAGVFKKIAKDKNIYAAIITGQGDKSFVAGADISEMKDLDQKRAHKFAAFGSSVFRSIEKLRVPVIAAINGYALGGGLELALACDIRIASEDAIFGLPEVGLGIICGYGGTQRLPRIIGPSRAKKMIYTAERIDARAALAIGLVDEVVKKDELIKRAMSLASVIASRAPIAVACAKEAVGSGIDLGMDDACLVETDIFCRCFATQDQKAVMDAFLKKEKFGKFKNR